MMFSFIFFLVTLVAAIRPATATLAVPWMSSLNVQYLSRYLARRGPAFGKAKSSNWKYQISEKKSLKQPQNKGCYRPKQAGISPQFIIFRSTNTYCRNESTHSVRRINHHRAVPVAWSAQADWSRTCAAINCFVSAFLFDKYCRTDHAGPAYVCSNQGKEIQKTTEEWLSNIIMLTRLAANP